MTDSKPSAAALLVGVSEPHAFTFERKLYEFAKLPSAAYDVERWRIRLSSLAESAGYELRVETLCGREATRDAILERLRELQDSLDIGGFLIFVLQGHGTEVPDLDGDERPRGSRVDQAFPTADDPIIDDDLWTMWQRREDLTIFSIADTCRAETLTVQLDFDHSFRQAGVQISSRALVQFKTDPIVKMVIRTRGPNIIQFAASARGTDAFGLGTGSREIGRFTRALLQASTDEALLTSYLTWFRAASATVIAGDPPQQPVLYYVGTDHHALEARPPFIRAARP